MPESEENIQQEVANVGKLSIIPTILEVICRTTGMGFSAVAKVTKDRWIACGVRDEIAFGLKPGGELKVETTICDEIRDSGQEVVIDHVAEDEQFRDHHTPLQYGFQSYISIPIVLKSGEFFGTLCAIDPKPARLKKPETIGMFKLFAEMIAGHIGSLRDGEQLSRALRESHIELRNYQDEIRQYKYVSNHNLQEPLRKIRLFTDILLTARENGDDEKVVASAEKIKLFSSNLSVLIRRLSDFSELTTSAQTLETTDLNDVLKDVVSRLRIQLEENNATIRSEVLHVIKAIPAQMTQLFYHLLSNSLKHARKDVPPVIRIYSKDLAPDKITNFQYLKPSANYCEICFEDNGIGIDPSQLEKIFDMFNRSAQIGQGEGPGIGLAQCRKIVRNHGGTITAHSEAGKGATFSVILPIK